MPSRSGSTSAGSTTTAPARCWPSSARWPSATAPAWSAATTWRAAALSRARPSCGRRTPGTSRTERSAHGRHHEGGVPPTGGRRRRDGGGGGGRRRVDGGTRGGGRLGARPRLAEVRGDGGVRLGGVLPPGAPDRILRTPGAARPRAGERRADRPQERVPQGAHRPGRGVRRGRGPGGRVPARRLRDPAGDHQPRQAHRGPAAPCLPRRGDDDLRPSDPPALRPGVGERGRPAQLPRRPRRPAHRRSVPLGARPPDRRRRPRRVPAMSHSRRGISMRSRRTPAAVVLAALALVVAAAGTARASNPPTVFAAASLTDVFPKIDPSARYSFAGSNTLALQIRQGAPADVFASAAPNFTQELYRDGLVEKPRFLTFNRLTVIV